MPQAKACFANLNGVPQHQRAVYQCECGCASFESLQCATMIYDRLDPGKMMPLPATMFRCVKCGKFLVNKDGAWKVVDFALLPGDEWKES